MSAGHKNKEKYNNMSLRNKLRMITGIIAVLEVSAEMLCAVLEPEETIPRRRRRGIKLKKGKVTKLPPKRKATSLKALQARAKKTLAQAKRLHAKIENEDIL